HRRKHHRADEGDQPQGAHHLHLLHPRPHGDEPRRARDPHGGREDHRRGEPRRRRGGVMERLRILFLMALRSLGGHKIKGLIVGSLLAFGTFLFVMGTTLLENIERAMEASITQSITGHVQLVSKDAVDRLAFFGPDASSEQDLGVLEDFPRIREVASRVPGVAAVVPMGRYYGQPILNTELDEAIEALEEAVAGGDAELIEDRIGKVRRMTKTLHEDFERLRLLVREDDPETEKALQVLDKATSDAFWEELRANP